MHTSDRAPAGNAAPTPATVALPKHSLSDLDELTLRVYARDHSDVPRVTVHWEEFDGKNMSRLSPAQARLLAVYLVDCANALDNPAARVIADDAPTNAERSLIQLQVDEAGGLHCAARGNEECMAYGVCGDAGRCVRSVPEGEGIGHE